MRTALDDRTESDRAPASAAPKTPPPSQFAASRRLLVAAQLGLGCELAEGRSRAGLERLRSRRGPELLWPGEGQLEGDPGMAFLAGPGDPVRIFARLTGDAVARRLLDEHGGSWSRVLALEGADGAPQASIWRCADGSVFLPFDPDEVCLNYWSERYRGTLRGTRERASEHALRLYYGARGALPRAVQIWLRRRYAPIQARTAFPRWPVESSVHDFLDLFTSIVADVAGEPVARIATWPNGHSWALVLTHDVETAAGAAALDPILELERGLGLRSCWNFVPRRYELADERVQQLRADGFEVGVHGLYHDGRDLESHATLQERLPAIREAARRWQADGFRAPATHRDWELMTLLGFDYDSSYPDTDPFEPYGGGCCTWLPFFNRELVELPLTMAQDHTLFVILRRHGAEAWVQKAELLRARGGMALIDTHPDYLLDGRILDAYRELLERYASDRTAWKALPVEVSRWWRRRDASGVGASGEEWVLTGPAADEGSIELA